LLSPLDRESPAESALEVIAARVLRTSDLPAPRRQVEVVACGAQYRLDFAWPAARVALECDGRKWHEMQRAFEHDRRRWSAITAETGYRIVWATWDRLQKDPASVLNQIRQLLEATSAQAAGEPPRVVRPFGRGERRPPARLAGTRSVGSGMTLSPVEPTRVSGGRAARTARSMAPPREDADG
jgi:very-short-patch-repair endonuclease